MSDSTISRIPILLLIAEDETWRVISESLDKSGFNNKKRLIGLAGLDDSLKEENFEIVILEILAPDHSYNDIHSVILGLDPSVPLIIITNINDIEVAVNCIKEGVFDYLVKPLNSKRLIDSVSKAVAFRGSITNLGTGGLYRDEIILKNPIGFEESVAVSPKMKSIFKYVESIAKTPKPILIIGETGVGKELVARAVHLISGRKGNLVAVNVGGLDENIFSDTLFGHVKGAFTGAEVERRGLIENAALGTLLLDEIGDLSPTSQVKLLRLLQDGEYFKLGSDTVHYSTARIIASTNKNLDELAKEGKFRYDLLFRLRTHQVIIPPLRERKEDLPFLLDHFLEKSARELGKKKPTPPPELLQLLCIYSFPGNIRELEAMVYDAVSRHEKRILSTSSFKAAIQESDSMENDKRIRFEKWKNFFSCMEAVPSLRSSTKLLIEEALHRAKNNITIAAQLLGITRSALSRRLSRARLKKSAK
jgi:DNA-binding NtrC family response regulator